MVALCSAQSSPSISLRAAAASMQLQLYMGVSACGTRDADGRGDEAMLAATRAKQEEEGRGLLLQAVAEKVAVDETRA
jgi:hypothetical protein